MTNLYSKRHYEDIAALLRNEGESWATYSDGIITVVDIINDFARRFAADNIHFDQDRFLWMCGLETKENKS